VGSHFWWHLARGSGLVAFALVSASIAFGLTLSTRLFGRRPAPAWLLDTHRWLGGLALTTTVLHIAALLADGYVQFDLVDVTVPFASPWRPGAVALGVIAVWLMVAIETTSWLMRRLPRRLWRAVHSSSLALFIAVVAHGWYAGSDARNTLVRTAGASMVLTIFFLFVVRLLTDRGAGTRRNRPAVSVAARRVA
jgi:DMSO/TMAO reductase YedYZ heme-binding membrane subunit